MDVQALAPAVNRRDLLKLSAAGSLATAMPALVGAQTPRRGGTFRIRGEDAVMGFDPHLAVNQFDKLAHTLRGGTPVADLTLYAGHIPGQPLNSSGVNDPKLTEMIRLQRRTFDVAKRREILYDIQRYLAEQVYYVYGPSFSTVSAWAPYVKNFAPNLGHDYGGRLMVSWLEK